MKKCLKIVIVIGLVGSISLAAFFIHRHKQKDALKVPNRATLVKLIERSNGGGYY